MSQESEKRHEGDKPELNEDELDHVSGGGGVRYDIGSVSGPHSVTGPRDRGIPPGVERERTIT
jgi:bacteriocin-like protein